MRKTHLVACLAQGLGQAVVAVVEGGDPPLCFGEAVFEHPYMAWGLGHLPAQGIDFLLEERRSTAQVGIVCRLARSRS